MKKTLYILVAVIIVVAGYFYFKTDDIKTGDSLNDQKAIYSKDDVGLKFDYRVGPDGYVLEERMPVDLGTGLVKVILLMRTADTLKTPPVGGEGPPVIAISIFENTKKQTAQVWADKNVQYSNINLKEGDISSVTIGGANAIRYTASGLYASENAVMAHGDNVYVVTGQYIDENSDIRKDFAPIIDSIVFIPKTDQE